MNWIKLLLFLIFIPTRILAQAENPLFAVYFNEQSNQIWANRADHSLQYFDLNTNELHTLEGTKAEQFWDYGKHYLLLYINQLFELDKKSHALKTLPSNIRSNALFTYYPARNTNLFVVKIIDFIEYQPAIFDIEMGKIKFLSSQRFENIHHIHEDKLGNFWLSDNNLYRYNKETNEWNLIFKMTKETDWLQKIKSTNNNLYVSTWNSLLIKFDLTNPEKEVNILSNVAPFKHKTFDVSQDETIVVAQGRRIAWLENGVWTELPIHKLNTIEGDIHHIQFIGDKKVLLNTGYSFGIIKLSE